MQAISPAVLSLLQLHALESKQCIQLETAAGKRLSERSVQCLESLEIHMEITADMILLSGGGFFFTLYGRIWVARGSCFVWDEAD